MKLFRILAVSIAVCLAATLQAQDLKPVKDKSTKKFGYQDKSKNWVIEPAFDKARRFIDGRAIVEVQGLEGLVDATGAWILRPEYNSIGKFDKLGLCELMVKDGRTKRYGLANSEGQIVLPPEFLSVSVNRSENLICARHDTPSGEGLWGVYSLEGDEIFAPVFSSSPSFRGGIGIARSSDTGLVGLIDNTGAVLLPFEHLAISERSGQREVLTKDFSIVTYDSRLDKTDILRSPGAVKPYDTFGDDVRAAAWRCACIGRKIYANSIATAESGRSTTGRTAWLSPLRVDMRTGRFIRLEPEEARTELPGCMEHPYNGKLYTLRAILYEADGTYCAIASDYGWLEGAFQGGWIYNCEGREKWIIFENVNHPARMRDAAIDLIDYYPIDNSNVVSGLCLGTADLKRMQDPGYRSKRETEIIEAENTGVTSYLPHPAPRDREDARIIREISHSPLFQRSWHIGEVVSCEVRRFSDEYRIELSDRLVCHFEDRIDNPSFYMSGDEEIFWGPNNGRTVALDLEAADGFSSDLTVDDVYGSGRKFKILVNMYEEDGRFLRTLGQAPSVSFNHDGLIVFEKLGIALKTRVHDRHGMHHEIKIPESERLAPALSALLPAKPQSAGQPDRPLPTRHSNPRNRE